MTDEHLFELNADLRKDVGRSASRRLRRQKDLIPAIVYGGDAEPKNISLKHNKITHALQNEAFYSQVLTLNIEDVKQRVVLKDIQRHPCKPRILHMDFQRITDNTIVNMTVPLHFSNSDKCPGVLKGGVVNHQLAHVEVSCAAKDLPEYITVNISNLDIEQSIHLSDLVLPNGVAIPELKQGKEHDLPVAAVHMPKVKSADEPKVADQSDSSTTTAPAT